MAMGKSRPGLSFGRSAGARLIVTFLAGNWKPELVIAARTRSRASETVLAAIPTILKVGRPRLESPSTSTNLPLKP